jgi:hypothetical protein
LPVFFGRRSVTGVSDRFGGGSDRRRRTLVDVGQDTTLCDGDVAKKLVQLLIISDSELEMSGNDTGLLVVTGGVSSKLENFGREVLENSSQVDRRTSTDTLSVVALSEKSVNTADRECQTSLRGPTAKKVSTRLGLDPKKNAMLGAE